MIFKILNKSKKIYYTPNNIIWSLIIVSFFLILIKNVIFGWDSFSLFDIFFYFLLFLSIVAGFIIPFVKRNKFETLQGELSGDLEFLEDEIKINGYTYNLINIEKITISATDFKGFSSQFNIQGNFDCYRSNGTDNSIELKLDSKNVINCKFEQIVRNQLRNEKLKLIHYCNEGKLHYLNLLDIMGIEDYNEIQDFKKKYLIQFQ